MRLKKHYVTQGETMQSIAQSYYGNTDAWLDLIEHNGLKFPYIVETQEEKLERPEEVVTYGDYLIIPIEQDLSNIQAQEINKRDREYLVDLSLGRDFNVTSKEDTIKNYGTNDEILSFTNSRSHDLDTVTGVDNIKQQLQMRLLTRKGSLMLHPEYGSNLHTLFERNVPEQALKIENDIHKTLLSDSRVETVTTKNWEMYGSQFNGTFEIKLRSIEDSISIVLGADESGIFALFQ